VYVTIIIIIIIRHQLDLDRPVSASSNNLFEGLPRRLLPFGLQFSIIFAILLLFILLPVVANLICVLLVSGQLVLLSVIQNFFIPFVFKSVYRLF
jgi:uncharacterized RDD family membrane protein YckC